MAPLTVWAIHTFVAEHGDELDFKAGEEIEVIEKDDAFGDGWWRGRNNKGEEGLFPATYISQDLPAHAESEAVTEKEDTPVEKETGYLVNGATNGTAASSETPTPTPPSPAPATASVDALNATTPGAYPSDNNVAASNALSPSESPNGTSTVDGPILDSASAAVGAAAGVAGAAAASVGTVMNRTIGDIQDAIESIAAPAESEDGDDHSELGIGQDARAKLVEQARLANEKRERDDGGFIYSDESDDEEDEYIRRRSLPLETKSRTSLGTADSPFGNGSTATAQKEVQAEPVARAPSPVKTPAAAVPFPTSAPVPRATPSPSNHIIAPEPTHDSNSQAAEPETSKSAVTPKLETPGTLEPAFFPTTPSVSQTPVARGLTQSPANGAGGITSSNVSHKSGNIPAKPPTTWTVDDVVAWAQAKGFDEGIVDKFKEHEISGDILLELDANLLKELDIPAFGKRMRIAAAISELRRPSSIVSSHSQQLSPSGLPGQGGYGGSSRGMSAPPSSLGYPGYPSTPPLSTPPLSASSGAGEEGIAYGAWSHGRKSSGHHASVPVMESINEHGGQQAQKQVQSPKEPEPKRVSQPASSAPSTSQAASSLPASPTTPATPATANSTKTTSTLNKRESTGSMSHKRGKPSLGGEAKDRLSFFGRKKPAPAGSPTAEGNRSVSRLGFGGGNKTHQVTPAVPAKRVSGPSNLGGSAEGGAVSGGSALQKIGNPDYSGYMKKKGERYGGWKSRYVVLKGPTLYVLKSEHADSLKDKINLHNHRVVADASAPSGSYGLRLAPNTSGDPAHFFSANEQTTVRGWMKALLKATIERDYTKPVTSSCNIPTIPLAEAQAMAPRPPSPATREATQRATRRDNPNQLTPHDATILTSLDTSSGQKRRSQLSAGAPSPGRPDRDSRRPSSHVSQTTQNTQRASTLGAGEALGAATSRGSGKALSGISFNPVDASEAPQLVQWVNDHLPEIYPRVTSFPQAFASGEVIFLLVKSLSGVEPSPPVGPEAFQPDPNGQPGIEGLFAMMDMLVDSGVGIEGVSINDVRTADEAGVLRLLKDVKSWHENGQKA